MKFTFYGHSAFEIETGGDVSRIKPKPIVIPAPMNPVTDRSRYHRGNAGDDDLPASFIGLPSSSAKARLAVP